MSEFQGFPKIPRLSRECVITEKLDGTNASVLVGEDGSFFVGSRTRWITPEQDNYGFAKWAVGHRDELIAGLGFGHHFGEWWGPGIQRGYGVAEKRFSLFNAAKWGDDTLRPKCCHVVPVLFAGLFSDDAINACLGRLQAQGSQASPGFMRPEGVIVYHTAARTMFKKTLDKDDEWKGKAA